MSENNRHYYYDKMCAIRDIFQEWVFGLSSRDSEEAFKEIKKIVEDE